MIFSLALAIGAFLLADESAASEPAITCTGEHRQGGVLVCRTTPGARVLLDDVETRANASGWVILGHDRDAPSETRLRVRVNGETVHDERYAVATAEYQIQRIEGLPPAMVTPPPEVLERIRREGVRKGRSHASRWDGDGFSEGFIQPTEGRVTSRFGAQRFYNGEPRAPHYGVDIAASTGTPVLAPAGGIVTLADTDMYFEGGLIFIDHGQGFNSAYLHLSEVLVEEGDVVEQGQLIARVGSTGRSTGPHLCWRIRWHGRNVDPFATLDLQTADLR